MSTAQDLSRSRKSKEDQALNSQPFAQLCETFAFFAVKISSDERFINRKGREEVAKDRKEDQ
jgi:hypothetical protein